MNYEKPDFMILNNKTPKKGYIENYLDIDLMKLEDLKYFCPLTHKAVVEQNKFYTLKPDSVNIRTFLERNGYSICCPNVIGTDKHVPSVVFFGHEVGIDRKYRTNPYDFEPVSMDKAKQFALIHALKDFEDNYYLVNRKV